MDTFRRGYQSVGWLLLLLLTQLGGGIASPQADLIFQCQVLAHQIGCFMDLTGKCPQRRDPKTMKLAGFSPLFYLSLDVIMMQHTKPNSHGLAIASGSIQQS